MLRAEGGESTRQIGSFRRIKPRWQHERHIGPSLHRQLAQLPRLILIEGIATSSINQHRLAGVAMGQRLGEHGGCWRHRKRDTQNPCECSKLLDRAGALAIRGDDQRRHTAQHHARGKLGGCQGFSRTRRAGQQ